MSDIGYYVGYCIARSYYDAARDKQRAVKELIALPYDSTRAVRELVDRSGYLKMGEAR